MEVSSLCLKGCRYASDVGLLNTHCAQSCLYLTNRDAPPMAASPKDTVRLHGRTIEEWIADIERYPGLPLPARVGAALVKYYAAQHEALRKEMLRHLEPGPTRCEWDES
jgi:hypothetical protein